jgi:hypothetical protein
MLFKEGMKTKQTQLGSFFLLFHFPLFSNYRYFKEEQKEQKEEEEEKKTKKQKEKPICQAFLFFLRRS